MKKHVFRRRNRLVTYPPTTYKTLIQLLKVVKENWPTWKSGLTQSFFFFWYFKVTFSLNFGVMVRISPNSAGFWSKLCLNFGF